MRGRSASATAEVARAKVAAKKRAVLEGILKAVESSVQKSREKRVMMDMVRIF